MYVGRCPSVFTRRFVVSGSWGNVLVTILGGERQKNWKYLVSKVWLAEAPQESHQALHFKMTFARQQSSGIFSLDAVTSAPNLDQKDYCCRPRKRVGTIPLYKF